MHKFQSVQEAKEFMVGRVVSEAQRQGVSLSDVEQKMLYFSETAWSLPDIGEVNEAFEQEYDQGAYEEKIAGLIRSFCAEARKRDSADLDAWKDALKMIGKEDHYLLVLVGIADGKMTPAGMGRQGIRWSWYFKAVGIGVGVLLACYVTFLAYIWWRS